MNFFNFSSGNKNTGQYKNIVPDRIDKSLRAGKDFYFLVTGDIHLTAEDYDNIVTPNSFKWKKIVLTSNWSFYKVGEDDFEISKESDTIQIAFNDAITYQKARKIADEIIENINATGQTAGLLVSGRPRIYLKSKTNQ